ncbi:MAG: hypothetical protein Q4F49_03335 [Pseudoxanthomonas suwonensis]|nr:hypothetical protein [Pseudoxanthomonas suwonensis]
MRPERAAVRARALTWLLLVAVGWSLLVLVLALLGMGGRIDAAAGGSVQAQPLPVPGPVPDGQLTGPVDYAEAVRRPLFFSGRRPLPFVLDGTDEGESADPFDFVLTGVLIAPGTRIATLQHPDGRDGPRVKEGEVVAGFPSWRLQSLAPRRAVFAGPDGERPLELRKFTGEGAPLPAPPRAAAAPAQARARAASGSDTGSAVPPPEPIDDDPRASVAASAAAEAAARAAEAASAADGASNADATPAPSANADETTQQSQIDAIRRRIQARREQLRQTQPPQP